MDKVIVPPLVLILAVESEPMSAIPPEPYALVEKFTAPEPVDRIAFGLKLIVAVSIRLSPATPLVALRLAPPAPVVIEPTLIAELPPEPELLSKLIRPLSVIIAPPVVMVAMAAPRPWVVILTTPALVIGVFEVSSVAAPSVLIKAVLLFAALVTKVILPPLVVID